MQPVILYYPKCATCAKALRWLEAEGYAVSRRDIVAQPPTAGELAEWAGRSTFALPKFFNTSGRLYREMGLKDRVATAPAAELLRLLASDGMLVRRPLLVTERGVCPGFKEDVWRELLR